MHWPHLFGGAFLFVPIQGEDGAVMACLFCAGSEATLSPNRGQMTASTMWIRKIFSASRQMLRG
jgi:hypothetical protein